ncbi:MAG: hypothetical protein WEA80_06835 [Gemmatimonadaceae bacterium]
MTRSRHGLHAPPANIHLDARSAPGTVFVSHAHSDHCSSAPRIICTRETAALHARRKRKKEAVTLDFHQPFTCGDATIELLPAGHTLGSAMAMIRSEKGTLVYTGDYKLRDNPFSPLALVPKCDVLVKEPTAALCDLHVELGYPFPGPGTWERFSPELLPGRVVLATPGWNKHPAADIPRARTVQLTGWACNPRARYMYGHCDLVLPISDHADFDDLVRTAVESGATKIYTVHGSPVFAAHLRAMELDAEHLAGHPNNVGASRRVSSPVTTASVPIQYSLDLM